jgi:hypothetical protein
VTQIRSSLLQSSLATLKQRGHFESWAEAVDPAYKEIIVESVAPTWLPIAVGIAHYQACDSLKLPQHELTAIGEAVGDRVQTTFLGTVTKVAQQAGVTPWASVAHFGRLWSRLFVGGSSQLARTGPKDLQIELHGLGLVRFQYFRNAYTGLVRAALMLFAARVAYVNVMRFQPSAEQMVVAASWV